MLLVFKTSDKCSAQSRSRISVYFYAFLFTLFFLKNLKERQCVFVHSNHHSLSKKVVRYKRNSKKHILNPESDTWGTKFESGLIMRRQRYFSFSKLLLHLPS